MVAKVSLFLSLRKKTGVNIQEIWHHYFKKNTKYILQWVLGLLDRETEINL